MVEYNCYVISQNQTGLVSREHEVLMFKVLLRHFLCLVLILHTYMAKKKMKSDSNLETLLETIQHSMTVLSSKQIIKVDHLFDFAKLTIPKIHSSFSWLTKKQLTPIKDLSVQILSSLYRGTNQDVIQSIHKEMCSFVISQLCSSAMDPQKACEWVMIIQEFQEEAVFQFIHSCICFVKDAFISAPKLDTSPLLETILDFAKKQPDIVKVFLSDMNDVQSCSKGTIRKLLVDIVATSCSSLSDIQQQFAFLQSKSSDKDAHVRCKAIQQLTDLGMEHSWHGLERLYDQTFVSVIYNLINIDRRLYLSCCSIEQKQ